MSEPRILREEVGPNGNVTAVVEDDGRSIHLYLEGTPESGFGTRAVWVRNRGKAPWLMEVERMQAGSAPMLQARYVVDPEGGPPLQQDKLEFLWFEDGDGVALIEDGDPIAVIPPWSGVEGFAGYARDCALEGPFCSPLGGPDSNPRLFLHLSRAAHFWNSWEDDTWPKIQEALLRTLRTGLGKEALVYEVGQNRFPPALLARFESKDRLALVTGGMSIRPQPKVDRSAPDPEAVKRIELGLAIDPALAGDGMALVRWLAGQSTLPWDRYLWLGPGHTIGCSALPVGPSGRKFTAVILDAAPAGAPDIHLPHQQDEHAALLWALPITEREQAWAEKRGGEALLAALREAGVGFVHRDRDELPL